MKTHIVSIDWVKDHLDDPQIKVIDCRFMLGQPQSGKESYIQDHIPGAVYFDLEKDLSGPKEAHGGRHPLPDVKELAEKLGSAGINETVSVVAYDDQGGAMASRLWWLLQYLGHSDAYVMDGGYSQWKAKGYPVTAKIPATTNTTFVPDVQNHMLVTMDDVKEKKGLDGVVLIDSREEKRYQGVEEPIDPVAGHIPGALNHFWKDSLNQEGGWKSGEAQKQRFQDIQLSDEVIVYCGSGVTACPNILALKEAGFDKVKLYAGSWSDWCSYLENPIATGEE